jgi:hypothetical protein
MLTLACDDKASWTLKEYHIAAYILRTKKALLHAGHLICLVKVRPDVVDQTIVGTFKEA